MMLSAIRQSAGNSQFGSQLTMPNPSRLDVKPHNMSVPSHDAPYYIQQDGV